MSEFQNLILTQEEDILTITVNREKKYNAINASTMKELEKAMEKVYDDNTIRGVIITGAGKKAFVAGADIVEVAELNEITARKFAESGQETFAMIENCYKPVIAAVNGFALGAGCELAMACHLRIVTPNVKFGLPEVKLGLIPGYGGTQRLPKLIGKGKALELMLTADMIDADTAITLNLANILATDQESLLETAKNTLRKILKNSPKAVGMVISSVNSMYSSLENGYQVEANNFGMATKTDDFKEGTGAFLEKREPNFSGK